MKYVVVNLKFEGIHSWKNCPFEDVSFLKNDHRHIFWVKAIKSVSHLDRDIEIIRFKRDLEDYCNSLKPIIQKEGWSCEKIANDILINFDCESVEVLEDGENGAIITKE